ncbi:hypothetical protein [Paractinoplanes abujensis]|uniref:SRPBCC family protein n=1 Tax=Paractinoplanes abujensis TaxID=882441 RepID=A0A7W7CSS6_9ACTN|nr:hypothetical protein [Actinoplanes abujensis]MBB4692286.1 hypothetical protein [Actinoplanes abujensis]
MATVRVEAVIEAAAAQVWEAVADVGSVHRRLAASSGTSRVPAVS